MNHGLSTGYGIVILDEMDYGPDLDMDSDPSGPFARVLTVSSIDYIINCTAR